MTLPRPFLPLALLAFALAAAPARAAPVPLLNAPNAQDVALAGTDVIVARTVTGGGVLVDAVPSQGGAARRLLTLPPRGHRSISDVLVAASPPRVAVVIGFRHVEGRLYTGPPTGPLQLDIQGSGSALFPIDAAVDGDRILLVEENED